MCLLPTPGAPEMSHDIFHQTLTFISEIFSYIIKLSFNCLDTKTNGLWDISGSLIILLNTLTYNHQSFSVKSRKLNDLLVGNHIQLVKNCERKDFV